MSAWIWSNAGRPGYFRTVEPLMVLECAFNNIRQRRHAMDLALGGFLDSRIRTDKPVSEIGHGGGVEEIYQSQVTSRWT